MTVEPVGKQRACRGSGVPRCRCRTSRGSRARASRPLRRRRTRSRCVDRSRGQPGPEQHGVDAGRRAGGNVGDHREPLVQQVDRRQEVEEAAAEAGPAPPAGLRPRRPPSTSTVVARSPASGGEPSTVSISVEPGHGVPAGGRTSGRVSRLASERRSSRVELGSCPPPGSGRRGTRRRSSPGASRCPAAATRDGADSRARRRRPG